MDRLYVIVRADLPAGLQMAQACHALRAFVEAHPDVDAQWHRDGGGNLVVLHARDEAHAAELEQRATGASLACARFVEPDLGGQLTAIAMCGQRARRLLASLPLAFAA